MVAAPLAASSTSSRLEPVLAWMAATTAPSTTGASAMRTRPRISSSISSSMATWAESTALVLILYVTMLGAAVGVRDAGHIGLESLLILVPDGLRLKLEVVIHALVGTFGLIMAWNGAVLAESVMAYKIPTLGLPEGINHLPLVIAGILIALFSLEHIVALWRDEDVIPSWH